MIRSMFGVLAGTALAAGLAGGAGAQQGGPTQDQSRLMLDGVRVTEGRFNAALQYYSAWSLGAPLFTDEVRELLDPGEPSWVPSGHLADLLVAHEDAMDLIVEATRLERCDFGTQFDKGVTALLPHLGTMRTTARLLVADARLKRAAGDYDGAAGRVAALFRLGEHASQGGVVINSLVGVAICSLAAEEADALLDAELVSRDGAADMLDAIGRFLSDDPGRMVEAIRGERDYFGGWVRETLAGPNAKERIAGLDELIGADIREYAIRLIENGGAELALAQLERAYADIIAAASSEDQVAAMEKVEQGVADGRYGILSRMLVPALSNAVRSTNRGVADVQAVRDRLLLLLG